MRLPQKKKPGDPVMAEDWNLLLDAVTARTPRSGNGLKLICSSGGFAYSSPPQMVTHISHPPFSVIGMEKAGGSYKVTIKEGWVIERRPQSDMHPAVKFHIPKTNGTALNATPRPQLTMAIGASAWCRVQTDMQGMVSTDPTIVVDTADHDGLHYYPQDPDESGQTGDYYIKLFKLVDAGGTPAVVVYQQSDIEHWAQLWTGQNIGTGARVFKEYTDDENTYKFRSIVGLGAISVTESANGSEIEISGEGGSGLNLNLKIHQSYFSKDSQGVVTLSRADYPDEILYFRNGILVAWNVDPDDGDPPIDLINTSVDRITLQDG